MQSVADDAVFRQVHAGIAVDRICGDRELTQSENEVADVYAPRIVEVRSYIRQHIGEQAFCADVEA